MIRVKPVTPWETGPPWIDAASSRSGRQHHGPPVRLRRGTRGFTYLENIMALAIFGLGLAGLLTLGNTIGERNRLALERTNATLIAQSQMEALKRAGYDALVDTGAVDGSLGPLDSQGASTPVGLYMVTWDIQNNVPLPYSKTISVTVAWNSLDTRPRNLTLQTVVTDVAP